VPYLSASIHRGGRWVRYPSKPLLRRLVLELWFAYHCFRELLRARENIDLVVLVFPPSLYALLVGLLLPRSIRKIGIVHDLQAVMGLNGRQTMRRALSQFVRAIERQAFEVCDQLIALSDQMARTIIESYSQHVAKIKVRYPFKTLVASGEVKRNLAHILKQGATHVVYSGAMGKKQNSKKLLEFFQAAAKEMPEVNFHLFSEGPTFQEYRTLCESNGFNGVQFHGLVGDTDLEELYARSAVQVIPQVQTESNGCFPSKLANILAAGCAVLAICNLESDLAQIINQTKVGAVAANWERDELMAKLRHVLNQAATEPREARQSAVSEILADRFNREKLVDLIVG